MNAEMSENDDLLDIFLSVATNERASTLKESDIFNTESNNPQKEVPDNSTSNVHSGDTDSSDDESNRNCEDRKYNECGREIKHLLCSPNESSPSFKQVSQRTSKWTSKPTVLSADSIPKNDEKVKFDVYVDPVFGLRIVNPLISSAVLKDRMVGREAVSFAKLNRYLQTYSKEKDWVIAGVIVNKSPVKTSQKGSQFSIWTLSDLKDDIKTVALFLFSSAHQNLWKTSVGIVVGILNPNVLDKRDGSKDEVCKKFNDVCGRLLTRGFTQLEKRHAVIYKRVKSLLPRRESERRAHPLARHCDILQAIETRISMLNMTYIKYIESDLLCFIPGKVLDEMKSVLALVESDQAPPRTHQLLQELRDLSSMAMEHFDEHILSRVKEQVERRTALSYGKVTVGSQAPKILYAQHALTNELHKVKKQSKTHKRHISYLTQSTHKLCQKLRKQNIRLKAQSVKLREQERKIQEQHSKIQEQEATLADIKKHIDEWDQKYTDLTTELVRARDDILSATTQRPISATAQTSVSKFFKSNIKPRMAHILPHKSYIALQFDLERKRKSNLLPEIPLKRKTPELDDKRKGDVTLNIPDLVDFKTNDVNKNEGNLLVDKLGAKFYGQDVGSLISSSLENLLKKPLAGIKSRKRKMPEDIDLD